MSDEIVVLCGGARGPSRATVLRLAPPRRNVGLHVAGLASDLAVPPAFLDLIELAAYVEAADVATRGERRRFRIVMPFREANVFRDPAVFVPLQRTLAALSGDEFRIEARDRTTRERTLFDDGERGHPLPAGKLDVVPFSGGLDSFAGALRLVRDNRNVVLVTHRTTPRIEPFVRKLVEHLQHGADGRVAFVPLWHEREGRGAPRTRGFLWTAVAGAIAATSPRSAVRFFENGVVSIGLPLSAAGLSLPVARLAHPRVLAGYQRLFSALAERSITVDNGFLFTTKAEVVRAADGEMLASTVSCTNRAPRGFTHCGLCAQCIDRRFATLAAGSKHDPASVYAVDLYTGDRPTGEQRAIVESYLRAASEIARATDHELFAQYGELARVLGHVPGGVDEAATKLVDLHRRHAAEVESVVDAGIREHATALRRGALPAGSLLVLAMPKTPPPSDPVSERPDRISRTAPPGVVRVLHLSDLHFSKRRAWDQDPVLSALARDVGRLANEGHKPDLVAITGDVADRGTPDEYALATRFLREQLLPASGVDTDRVLLVPGNHDVDRSSVKRVAQAAQADLLRAESQDAIAAILSDPSERAPLLRRHEAWLSFVASLGAPHDELPWWSRHIHVGAIDVHVAGLCSSWAAWCDEDKGRLLLGRAQLHQVLAGADRAHLSLALVHHPWDYLADFDAAEARESIHRRCDVLLRGHLHKGEGAARIRPDGGSLELAAGASWGGTQHPHGYQLIELDPSAGLARVFLRTWDGHDWIADRNAYRGAAPDGVATFPLRGRRGLV